MVDNKLNKLSLQRLHSLLILTVNAHCANVDLTKEMIILGNQLLCPTAPAQSVAGRVDSFLTMANRQREFSLGYSRGKYLETERVLWIQNIPFVSGARLQVVHH